MPELIRGKATICIVNYKTLDFTRLCLRSIRKFTRYPYEIVVVDNNSGDESLEYLRSLEWIHLIERDTRSDPPGGSGGYAHAAGLDLGLDNCNTEFFVAMHSDTFVIRDNWLTELINYFDESKNNASRATSNSTGHLTVEKRGTVIACVGSGKIELMPPPFCFAKAMQQGRIILKKATDLRTFGHKLLREPDPDGKFRYYNRTICCLYRTEILRREGFSFLMDRDKGLTSGKKLYFELVDRGYKTVELPASVMSRYVVHLAHATQVVNPAEFKLRNKTIHKCNRVTKQLMSSQTIREILSDDSLDR